MKSSQGAATPYTRRTSFPELASKHAGKFLAIHIETGEYEIAADEMKAGDEPLARLPEAQIWTARRGYTSTRRFGGRELR